MSMSKNVNNIYMNLYKHNSNAFSFLKCQDCSNRYRYFDIRKGTEISIALKAKSATYLDISKMSFQVVISGRDEGSRSFTEMNCVDYDSIHVALLVKLLNDSRYDVIT